MQISLGRNWVLELTFKLERACSTARRPRIRRRGVPGTLTGGSQRHLQWERDKLTGQMLSGWAERLD